jgi:N-acyl-D-aspartate/D-glutamate deacylase
LLLLLALMASAADLAFVNARIIDGSGGPPLENATLLVHDGRVQVVGRSVKVPADARRIDASGKTIIPGLINGHGHVNAPSQLGLYARYGVTTVFSLGGDKEVESETRLARSSRLRRSTARVSTSRDASRWRKRPSKGAKT